MRINGVPPTLGAFVDLVTMKDRDGLPHSYARVHKGFRVPIEAMKPEDIRAALAARYKGMFDGLK